MLTFQDVKRKLQHLPEIDLLEILEISSEDIVDRFEDKIEERMSYFCEDLQEEDDELS